MPAQEVAEAVRKTPSVPDPKEQRALASEKREGARAATKPSADTYCIKRHKRKNYPTAIAIFDRKNKKQVVQLVATVIPDADHRMDTLAGELNTGNITEEDAIRIVNQIKTKRQTENDEKDEAED